MLTACRKSCDLCVAQNVILTMVKEVSALKLSLAEFIPSTTIAPTAATTTNVLLTLARDLRWMKLKLAELKAKTTVPNEWPQYGTTEHQKLVVTPNCADTNPHCPAWALAGKCIYQMSVCRKSCNQCSVPNVLLTMATEIGAIKSALADLRTSTTIHLV